MVEAVVVVVVVAYFYDDGGLVVVVAMVVAMAVAVVGTAYRQHGFHIFNFALFLGFSRHILIRFYPPPIQ